MLLLVSGAAAPADPPTSFALELPPLSIYDYCSHIRDCPVREIQLRDAKMNLSAVVDRAVGGEPSVITRHGRPEAVILGFEEWERLSQVPSFGRLLMSVPSGVDDLPARDVSPIRRVDL